MEYEKTLTEAEFCDECIARSCATLLMAPIGVHKLYHNISKYSHRNKFSEAEKNT